VTIYDLLLFDRAAISNAQIQNHNPDEIARPLAERIRAERLRREWKQATLAERSSVSLPTIRR